MVINANFGLGESVVSGEGEVDQWILDKKTRAVLSASIGKKNRRIVGAATGTHEVEVSDMDAAQLSLDQGQLAAVTDLLLRVEESFAFRQDIEWAFAAGRLWLLQSRPITTIPPRWTRDESAERFPNVITPLTWDFVESGFHRSLNHSFGLLGFPHFSGKWFAMFDHYIYGNQNAVELYARRAPFNVRALDELRAALPRLRQQFAWVQELPIAWMRDLDHYLITLGRFQAVPLDDKTPLEIWRHVLEVNEHGAQYFLPNIAISIAQGSLHRIFQGETTTGRPRSLGLTERHALRGRTSAPNANVRPGRSAARKIRRNGSTWCIRINFRPAISRSAGSAKCALPSRFMVEGNPIVRGGIPVNFPACFAAAKNSFKKAVARLSDLFSIVISILELFWGEQPPFSPSVGGEVSSS